MRSVTQVADSCRREKVVSVLDEHLGAADWDDGSLGAEFDLERPNAARMYDYWLGGAANLAVDRELAQRMIAIDPAVVDIARANRSFLRRAVRYCVANGINAVPRSRLRHPDRRQRARHRPTRRPPRASGLCGHRRHRGRAQQTPVAAQPVGQHHPGRPARHRSRTGRSDRHRTARPQPTRRPARADGAATTSRTTPPSIIARYRAHLAPGSFLVVSHLTGDEREINMPALASADPNIRVHLRSRTEIVALLDDAQLVDPGVVGAPDWRPDDPHEHRAGSHAGSYVAVARVP